MNNVKNEKNFRKKNYFLFVYSLSSRCLCLPGFLLSLTNSRCSSFTILLVSNPSDTNLSVKLFPLPLDCVPVCQSLKLFVFRVLASKASSSLTFATDELTPESEFLKKIRRLRQCVVIEYRKENIKQHTSHCIGMFKGCKCDVNPKNTVTNDEAL